MEAAALSPTTQIWPGGTVRTSGGPAGRSTVTVSPGCGTWRGQAPVVRRRGAGGSRQGRVSRAQGGGANAKQAERARTQSSAHRATHQWVALRGTHVAGTTRARPLRPHPHSSGAQGNTLFKKTWHHFTGEEVNAHTSPPIRLIMDTRRSVGLLSVTTSPTVRTVFALSP